ncbi:MULTISPECIES: GNAT family N-acetyltransferase [Halococcus]|uniref:Acetyltransferase n=1 Tax=Halococcus salifodinae DSM 8989 TaxID=1227456 RepID=M0NAY6_9EURY|nr:MULTISPECIES: GNAT family N-acetyltransferase [Halococcus]EMA55127.1 acetyltransferase [Halococcus salifodinae DSM 8989]
MGVLDGAALAVEADAVRGAIDREAVLVAVVDDRVLGACVLDDQEITTIAVRRARRDQGIGTRLVETAAEHHTANDAPLIAWFDAPVRPFYTSLGFAIEPADEPGRFRGQLD